VSLPLGRDPTGCEPFGPRSHKRRYGFPLPLSSFQRASLVALWALALAGRAPSLRAGAPCDGGRVVIPPARHVKHFSDHCFQRQTRIARTFDRAPSALSTDRSPVSRRSFTGRSEGAGAPGSAAPPPPPCARRRRDGSQYLDTGIVTDRRADIVARAGAGPAGRPRRVEKADVRRGSRPQTRRVRRTASEDLGPVGLGRDPRRPSATRAFARGTMLSAARRAGPAPALNPRYDCSNMSMPPCLGEHERQAARVVSVSLWRPEKRLGRREIRRAAGTLRPPDSLAERSAFTRRTSAAPAARAACGRPARRRRGSAR
jgi:hypothetical protein